MSVSLTLSSFSHIKVGKSYWKFNNSLLKDECYVDYMSLFLDACVRSIPSDEDLLAWWDELKEWIKEETITFSQNKKKRDNFLMNSLRRDYFNFDRQGNWEEALSIKEKILQLQKDRLKVKL